MREESGLAHLTMLLSTTMARDRAALLSQELIGKLGSAVAVFESDPEDLVLEANVTPRQAQLVCLLPSLARVIKRDAFGPSPVLDSMEKAGEYAKTLFYGERYERFCMLCLNKDFQLISAVALQEGSTSETPFYPRLVIEAAIRQMADLVIFTHNHPGGSHSFSMADFISTKQAIRILSGIGVALLDHILVASGSAISMRKRHFIVEEDWLAYGPTNELAARWLRGR